MGAFSLGSVLDLSVKCSRRLGIRAVVLRIARDGEEAKDLPLSFFEMSRGVDEYRLSLPLDKTFCGGEDGLFYYECLFLRGFDTWFSQTDNNVDLALGESSDRRYRLLVYKEDYKAPPWFAGGVMYHAFVDRFYKGNGKVGSRDDAEINEDWYGGIKQYAAYPGAPVKNNEFFGGNLWGIASHAGRKRKY